MTSYRLSAGGRIDRAKPLDFTFDGKPLAGYRRRHARLGPACQRPSSSSAAVSSIIGRAAS